MDILISTMSALKTHITHFNPLGIITATATPNNPNTFLTLKI